MSNARSAAPAAPAGPVVNVRGVEQFEDEVLSSALPAIVDFWAPWCAPCRAMAPAFEEAARQWEGRVLFAKIDTDAIPRLGQAFQITSLPTLLVLHEGEVVDVRIGASPLATLDAMAQRARDRADGIGFLARIKRSIGLGAK